MCFKFLCSFWEDCREYNKIWRDFKHEFSSKLGMKYTLQAPLLRFFIPWHFKSYWIQEWLSSGRIFLLSNQVPAKTSYFQEPQNWSFSTLPKFLKSMSHKVILKIPTKQIQVNSNYLRFWNKSQLCVFTHSNHIYEN